MILHLAAAESGGRFYGSLICSCGHRWHRPYATWREAIDRARDEAAVHEGIHEEAVLTRLSASLRERRPK